MVFHCYADDTQLYLPLKCDDDSKLTYLIDCLDEIKVWMATSFLQLNESKSEVVIFGPLKLAKKLALHLCPLATNVNTQARNLGVIIDLNVVFSNWGALLNCRTSWLLKIWRLWFMLLFNPAWIIAILYIWDCLAFSVAVGGKCCGQTSDRHGEMF